MDVLSAVARSVGFFTRAEALDTGHDDGDLAEAVRRGQLRRFRRGCYAFAAQWDALDDVGRHRVRSRAVLRSLGDAVCLSHVSAAVEHGADIWGHALDRVHVTRLDGGAGRVEGDVVHHKGVCLDADVHLVDGRRVMAADRCAIETATLGTPEAGLTLFNSMLHHGTVDRDQLGRRHRAMAQWPGARRLHVPVRMADARPQSVGESRGAWLCWAEHLPAPEPQFEVRDSAGVLVATCDWGWPAHGLVGEFDGRIKYGRLLEPGMTAGDVVFAEKQREDLIREVTDLRMVRIIWSDYQRPGLTAQRIRRLFR